MRPRSAFGVALPFLLAFGGCVATNRVGNWRPQTAARYRDYDECVLNAPPAEVVSMSAGRAAHCESVAACMEARGYGLRPEPVWEKLGDGVLFPFYWLSAIGGACYNR